jgi:hypothetical protein
MELIHGGSGGLKRGNGVKARCFDRLNRSTGFSPTASPGPGDLVGMDMLMQASQMVLGLGPIAAIATLATLALSPPGAAVQGPPGPQGHPAAIAPATEGAHLRLLAAPRVFTPAQGLEAITGGNFRPPGPVGAPRRTEGGATRGSDRCATLMLPKFSALDATGEAFEYGYSRVRADQPVFYLQVPDREVTVRFTLSDRETAEVIYRTQLTTRGKGGIYALAIPQEYDGKPIALTPERVVQGTVQSACLDPLTADWTVKQEEGLLYPVALDTAVVNALDGATGPRDRALIYAREGLWNDLLAVFLDWQQANPDDPAIAAEWQALLERLAANFPTGTPEQPDPTRTFLTQAAQLPLSPVPPSEEN